MKKPWIRVLMTLTLISGLWALRPVTDAIGAAITRTRVVNTVRVKESGAIVRKIFDTQMAAGGRYGADTNLRDSRPFGSPSIRRRLTEAHRAPPCRPTTTAAGPPRTGSG